MAGINNIAATFSAARALQSPSPSSKATATVSSSSTSSAPLSVVSGAPAARSISASWNPHSALRRSQRYNLLGLYGLPGPRPLRHPAVLLHPPSINSPAPISVVNRIPNADLSYLDENGAVRTDSLFDHTSKRKAAIGAQTPITAPISIGGQIPNTDLSYLYKNGAVRSISLLNPTSGQIGPQIPITVPISVGDRLPNAVLSYLDENGVVRTVSLLDLTSKRTAVIMAVPGAFVAGGGVGFMSPEALVGRASEMKEKGGAASVVVLCVAANDVHVMRAWGESLGAAEGGVLMLSDPDAQLAAALGMAVDMRGRADGFGVRSAGYCLVAVNAVVRAMFLNNSTAAAAAAGFEDVLRVL